MSEYTIYHNPRCSKSRTTLALLEQHRIVPIVVEYLKTPPSQRELASILQKLGISAAQLIRKKESIYESLNLENKSESELMNAMIEHPILIERPIVIADNKAVIGRPPENVLALL